MVRGCLCLFHVDGLLRDIQALQGRWAKSLLLVRLIFLDFFHFVFHKNIFNRTDIEGGLFYILIWNTAKQTQHSSGSRATKIPLAKDIGSWNSIIEVPRIGMPVWNRVRQEQKV